MNPIKDGKFITIYPKTETEFISLLDKLKILTDSFLPGPYILNDMQWKEGHVFFRYGAFKSLKVKKDGKVIYAIVDPEGHPIEDKRSPYFSMPSFVEQPKYVLKHNYFAHKEAFKNIHKYELKSALHFSNAGGVYLARKHNSDLDIILKEGRPYAGLDANGLDGKTRIKNEYKTLNKLKHVNGVVNVKEYFESWNHSYLSENKINGITIDEFISTQFPFSNNIKVDNYMSNCKIIINSLISTINEIHKNQIAVGDLQPSNILVSKEKNQIKTTLIDFESAHPIKQPYNPGLMTPGFMNRRISTYGQSDWFALAKIAHYLFMPIQPIHELDPNIVSRQQNNIQRKFGRSAVDFLNDVDNFTSEYVNLKLPSFYFNYSISNPKRKLDKNNVRYFIGKLASGIKDNMNTETEGLIKGDVSQYENKSRMISVANGGFGALWALKASNKLLMTPKINKWIKRSFNSIHSLNFEFDNIGLFTGTSGVANILFKLGYKSEANQIMTKINPNLELNNISLYSGLSGIGMAFIAFFEKTQNELFKKQAERISKYLKLKFLNFQDNKTNEEFVPGLMNGWLGCALFFLTQGKLFKNSDLIGFARRIINYTIKNYTIEEQQGIFIKDDSRGFERLIPYFNSGIAGLGWILQKIKNSSPTHFNEKDENLLNKIIRTNNSFGTYYGGLMDGFAGLILLDKETHNSKTLNLKLQNLNNYLISFNNNVFIPGKFAYKCSLDFSTGSAGILIVLNNLISNKNGSWLPLI